MSRRVIPAGDSLKDFHRAGGEPGPNRNRAKDSDPRRAWRTHLISRFAGKVAPESFTVLGGGTSLHRHLIRVLPRSRIPEF